MHKGNEHYVESIPEKPGGCGTRECVSRVAREDILEAINYAEAILANEDIEEVLVNVDR